MVTSPESTHPLVKVAPTVSPGSAGSTVVGHPPQTPTPVDLWDVKIIIIIALGIHSFLGLLKDNFIRDSLFFDHSTSKKMGRKKRSRDSSREKKTVEIDDRFKERLGKKISTWERLL